MPESCPICTKPLHSIITRRLGDHGVCLDCGDLINPLVTAIAEGLLNRAAIWLERNPTDFPTEMVRRFVRDELDNNFMPLISFEQQSIVEAVLK